MIGKQDILDRAAEWNLRADVVEKDYVLGWLLAALGDNADTGDKWVFKGGTCLKKCYVETYRFSEDLDFTLRADAAYDEAGLRTVLSRVALACAEASGIAFFPDELILKVQKNRRGGPTWEARLGYRGPMATPGQAKVRFDLTRFEQVIISAERRTIFHAYPDALPADAAVTCYSIDELLAEKTRALIERTRPRDLYDVVLLLDNSVNLLQLPRVRDTLVAKCTAKAVVLPSAAGLVALVKADGELRSEWDNMLGHQLPALPNLDDLIARLGALVGWLDAAVVRVATPALTSARFGRGEPPPLVAPRSTQFWGAGVPLEAIRFAGANRLLVEFTYDGVLRRVEPYSFRCPATGNLLLYAWEQGETHIKAFNIAKIGSVRITNQTFSPRYLVEFTA